MLVNCHFSQVAPILMNFCELHCPKVPVTHVVLFAKEEKLNYYQYLEMHHSSVSHSSQTAAGSLSFGQSVDADTSSKASL